MLVASGVLLVRVTLFMALFVTASRDQFWWALGLAELSLLTDLLVLKLFSQHEPSELFMHWLGPFVLPFSSTALAMALLFLGLIDHVNWSMMVVLGGLLLFNIIDTLVVVPRLKRTIPFLGDNGLIIVILSGLMCICVWLATTSVLIAVGLIILLLVQAIYVVSILPAHMRAA